LNLGGPDSLEAVEPFLVNLFSDPFLIRLPLRGALRRAFARWVARKRAPHVRKLYGEIGGRSPIEPITRRQAEQLQAWLGPDYRCYVAFSAWTPYIREAVARARAEGCERLVGVSLFPQWCSATTGSVLHDLRTEARRFALPATAVESYPGDALYLDALAATVHDGLRRFGEREPVHVVFSAHGVPVSIIKKGDPYERDIRTTVAGIVARLPPGQAWSLSFQSKVGPVKWLEPATANHLPALAAQGVRSVLVVPVAFVSDHIETLHEQRILLRGVAESAGIERYEVADALNDCVLYARALARLVKEAEARPWTS
jgi:ferrochelatase